MTYLGNSPTTQSFISGTDYFNGDGSTVAFTLSRTVVSPNDVEAVINNVVQQPNSAYTISGTTITFTSAPSSGTSNIYVRYLSTTTQSITPSQNTVSYSTLNSDTQSKLGIMYKNRIINGAMVIDQRNAGASVNITSNLYTLDRWIAYQTNTSAISVQQNAGSVTAPAGFKNYLGVNSLTSTSISAGSYFLITQSVEGYNIADLNWGTANAKTITVSFWVRSSLTGTFGGSINDQGGTYCYPFTYTISSANTWEYKTITIVGPTSGTWGSVNDKGFAFRFSLGCGATYTGTPNAWTAGDYYQGTGSTSVVGTNGATWYLTGVQLEVGTQATTFTNAGGSYGGELALCQRYFEVLGAGTILTGASSGNYGHMLRYAVTKRTTPTFVKTANYLVSTQANAQTITAISSIGYETNAGCTLNVTPNNNIGVTNGDCIYYADSSNRIQASAEL